VTHLIGVAQQSPDSRLGPPHSAFTQAATRGTVRFFELVEAVRADESKHRREVLILPVQDSVDDGLRDVGGVFTP
jgi:hypothetical protein